ncbi:hypothetical protein ACFIJ5_15130 [Haloimpatiens sp. FM7330]
MSKKVIALVIMGTMLGSNVVYAEDVVEKEESVYVTLTQEGKIKDEIVSNWLHSDDKDAKIEDNSILKQVKNVKGDEIPKVEGNKLIWDSKQNDIFYQGKTDKKLPVDIDIRYYLDGREIKPKDLAGKSGKIKIKVDFKNNDAHVVNIKGKNRKIYTPFTTVAVLNFPMDKFKNVEINEGKMISDGNNQVVTFIGFPGVEDSLDLDKYDLGEEKINIPQNLEVTADVDKFELGPVMITTTPELVDLEKLEEADEVDELKDGLNDLEDAAQKLVDGSNELSDGVHEAKSKLQEKLDELDEKSHLTDLVEKDEYVNGARLLIKDSFEVLGLDTSLLDFSTKYATKDNIELAKTVSDDIKDLDMDSILDDDSIINDSFLKSLPDFLTDENIDSANKLMDRTDELSDVDMDKIKPFKKLMRDSRELTTIADYGDTLYRELDDSKLEPLMQFIGLKGYFKRIYEDAVKVKSISERHIEPAMRKYIDDKKDQLKPVIEQQVKEATATKKQFESAKKVIEKGVVPPELKPLLTKLVDKGIGVKEEQLKSIIAKGKLSEENKKELLYLVENAINVQEAKLKDVIKVGKLDDETKAYVKPIVNQIIVTKKNVMLKAINEEKLTKQQIGEICAIIDKIDNKVLDAKTKKMLKGALQTGAYKGNDKLKKNISNIVSLAYGEKMKELNKLIDAGTIPEQLKPEITKMVMGALEYKKDSLKKAIESGKLDESAKNDLNRIVSESMVVVKTKMKNNIESGTLDESDKQTLNTVINEAIKTIDQKLKEVNELMDKLSKNKPLTKSQLEMIVDVIKKNNQELETAVEGSDLKDRYKKEISDIIDLVNGTVGNEEVLDGFVSLENMKLNIDTIMRHTDMNKTKESIHYVSNLVPQVNAFKNYLDKHKYALDEAKKALTDDNIKYVKDMTEKLKDMKKDLDDNKENIDTIKDLLDKSKKFLDENKDFDIEDMKDKMKTLNKDLDRVKPIFDQMKDEMEQKGLEEKLDDAPELLEKVNNMKKDLEMNRKVLELTQEALNDNNVKMARELMDALPDLEDGIDKLEDGSKELSDGMDKFKKEGIDKIDDELNEKVDDVEELMDTKDEIVKLSDNYKTFTGIGKNMTGKVKFIMKTEEIKMPKVEKTVAKKTKDEKGGFIHWLKNLFHIK